MLLSPRCMAPSASMAIRAATLGSCPAIHRSCESPAPPGAEQIGLYQSITKTGEKGKRNTLSFTLSLSYKKASKPSPRVRGLDASWTGSLLTPLVKKEKISSSHCLGNVFLLSPCHTVIYVDPERLMTLKTLKKNRLFQRKNWSVI